MNGSDDRFVKLLLSAPFSGVFFFIIPSSLSLSLVSCRECLHPTLLFLYTGGEQMVECWPSICRHFHAGGMRVILNYYWEGASEREIDRSRHLVEREVFFSPPPHPTPLDITFSLLFLTVGVLLIMSNAPIEDCYRVVAPSWVGGVQSI